MPRPHRWPIVVGVLGLLPVLYVLSEAPLVRLTRQMPYRGWWSAYKPVDWLYDETPLQRPLLLWAKLWEVEHTMKNAASYRNTVPLPPVP